jgi:hypothetical protein
MKKVLCSINCQSYNIGRIHERNEKCLKTQKNTKRRGFSPQANYTDLATAACQRS